MMVLLIALEAFKVWKIDELLKADYKSRFSKTTDFKTVEAAVLCGILMSKFDIANFIFLLRGSIR